MSKRTTIKDIARVLSISTSTVSRALADRWDVNPETREAVLKVAEELNYRPNTISIGLRSQRSFCVGVVIPEFINSFFAEVLIGIQSVLTPKNYHVIVCQSNESAKMEKDNLNLLDSIIVDGYIVSVAGDGNDPSVYQSHIDKGTPVVFFNRVPNTIDAPKVIIDDRKWAYNATNHLIEQGCKRIAHLAGPNNLLVSKQRRLGYLDALRKNNMKIDPNLIIPTGIVMEQGVIAAMKILKMENRPDGIFAMTDPVAIGALLTFKKHGINIPEDIAIVGFTENPSATIVEPNLTTIEQPTFEIGEAAAKLLLKQLDNPDSPSQTIILDSKLNIRESSLKSK